LDSDRLTVYENHFCPICVNVNLSRTSVENLGRIARNRVNVLNRLTDCNSPRVSRWGRVSLRDLRCGSRGSRRLLRLVQHLVLRQVGILHLLLQFSFGQGTVAAQ
jgi:hypothetical protein